MGSQQYSRVRWAAWQIIIKIEKKDYKSHSNEQKNLKWKLGVGDLSTDST